MEVRQGAPGGLWANSFKTQVLGTGGRRWTRAHLGDPVWMTPGQQAGRREFEARHTVLSLGSISFCPLAWFCSGLHTVIRGKRGESNYQCGAKSGVSSELGDWGREGPGVLWGEMLPASLSVPIVAGRCDLRGCVRVFLPGGVGAARGSSETPVPRCDAGELRTCVIAG